ncbi:tail fiber assembly protein [Pseudomonas sp. NPDC086278]|uniref:tail fiber assembly protein n=1 Tax=Pseudomonas sp. NPDC086278 TaxID=3390646 RepID=UPI003D0042FE
MALYAKIEFSNVVTQLLETDQGKPADSPPWFQWVDVTGVADIGLGYRATYMYPGWTFTKPTEQALRNDAEGKRIQLLNAAVTWLLNNPVHYKVDIGVASPAEEALTLAYKQYFVAVSEVAQQPDFPFTINWPVAPF